MNATAIQNKEPLTVNEVLNSSEKNEWRQAMEEEVKSMLLLLFLLVDIQSNNKVEKDNDPSSNTDHETQSHHFISIGGI